MANDGNHVWVGNNEDEAPTMNYRFYFINSTNKNYGYMLWSEFHNHPEYDPIMDQYPQGGLNEYGLFMDYTAIDEIPVKEDENKEIRTKEVINDILKSCKTVEEAITFINKYNLINLASAQLYIADASGDYATVHGNYIVRKTSENFALTNYCIDESCTKEKCWRRETADNLLNTKGKQFELEDIKNILNSTAQKSTSDIITNYSMAVNLKTQTIYLYYKTDFSQYATIPLSSAIKKEKYFKDIQDYFL